MTILKLPSNFSIRVGLNLKIGMATIVMVARSIGILNWIELKRYLKMEAFYKTRVKAKKQA